MVSLTDQLPCLKVAPSATTTEVVLVRVHGVSFEPGFEACVEYGARQG